MTLTAEQMQAVEAKIAEMLAGGKFFKKEDASNGGNKQKDDDPTTLQKAQKDAEDKAKQNALIGETEGATKFELGFDKLKEDYADFMPAETDSIVTVVKNQKHDNSVTKVREIKVALLDSFFQVQRNVDSVKDSMREKISKYKDLTQEAKRENVQQYWEVFEVALDNLKQAQKFEQASKANGQRSTATGAEAKYNDKIFAKAEFYSSRK